MASLSALRKNKSPLYNLLNRSRIASEVLASKVNLAGEGYLVVLVLVVKI